MGPLLERCVYRAAQEPPAALWPAALPGKEFPGIALLEQAGNFLSANLTPPYSENSSNPKASK